MDDTFQFTPIQKLIPLFTFMIYLLVICLQAEQVPTQCLFTIFFNEDEQELQFGLTCRPAFPSKTPEPFHERTKTQTFSEIEAFTETETFTPSGTFAETPFVKVEYPVNHKHCWKMMRIRRKPSWKAKSWLKAKRGLRPRVILE
jgi:hypothetical protein